MHKNCISQIGEQCAILDKNYDLKNDFVNINKNPSRIKIRDLRFTNLIL